MSHHQHSRVRRAFSLSAIALTLALLGAACAPDPAGPPGPSANQQFCEFFEKVSEAPPTADTAVVVKDDVVALADSATVIGDDCQQPAAKVQLNGAVVAEGEEVPSEEGNPSSEPIAAVTGSEIAAGETVLENVQLTGLSAYIDQYGITVRGTVALRLSGVTSTIGFTGTLQDLNNWSINLASSGLTIPGISSTPVTFSGTLTVRNGAPSLALTARATAAKIGDVLVNQAEIDLKASERDGVTAKVIGDIKVGPSTVRGSVNVEFDRLGTLVSAKADISARLVGTQADGKKIDLQGTVKLDGNARETVASFSGSGVVGDLQVHEANGSLTLATNKATFSGVLDVEQGGNYLRFNGTIVWDGIAAHVPFLQIEGAGEISGTLDNGQKFSVAGSVQGEVIGNQVRSVITGRFQVGTLKAQGRAVLEANGATTVLEVDADIIDAGFAAKLQGVVQITDGRAELVQLDASVTGPVTLGDLTLVGAQLRLRSTYGNPIDVSFEGGVKIGSQADVFGSVAASIGPNGTLLSLNGSVTGSLQLGSWGLANFNGSVVATSEQVSLTGAGDVRLINFPLGLRVNGTLTSSLARPSWSLNGVGRLRIASIEVASARLSLSQSEGMKATRVGFYFSIIGIPTYFEGNFYMKPEGGCDKVDITGGSLIAKLILVTVMPGVIGCRVNI